MLKNLLAAAVLATIIGILLHDHVPAGVLVMMELVVLSVFFAPRQEEPWSLRYIVACEATSKVMGAGIMIGIQWLSFAVMEVASAIGAAYRWVRSLRSAPQPKGRHKHRAARFSDESGQASRVRSKSASTSKRRAAS